MEVGIRRDKKHTAHSSKLGTPVFYDNEQELALWMLLLPGCPEANFDQFHIKQFLNDENTIKTKIKTSRQPQD